MNPSCSENFSYDYYVRILKAIKSKFNVRLLGEGLIPASDETSRQLFLRHDVDVDLLRALSMAEIEAENGIRSTYMFMPRSRLYDIRSVPEVLKRFVSLKHEVALHFHIDEGMRSRKAVIEDFFEDIERECKIISEITGVAVKSVSFHRPMPQFLPGKFKINGLINAYSYILMESYISDSKGEWRLGEPFSFLLSAEKPILQVLIHPIWWGKHHMSPSTRLEEFYLESSVEMTTEERKNFDINLALTIPAVRRSGVREA